MIALVAAFVFAPQLALSEAPQGRVEGSEIPKFREQLVDDQLDDLWHAGVADVNNDGKPDVLALNWGPAYVVWYENPAPSAPLGTGWKKRILIEKEPRELVALRPIKVEGKTAFVLGAGYHEPPDPKKGGGEIYLLRPPDAADKPWTPIKIGAIPTLHRIHLLNGRDLVCSALHGPTIVLRRPPSPFTDPWPAETVDAGLKACHNTLSVDWDGDSRDEIITASADGLLLHRRNDEGVWEKRTLAKGAPGCSEVAAGWLPGGRRYLATIEPHHGHELCIYTPPDQPDGLWKRRVLHVNKGGHTLLPVDLHRTGVDSLLVGFVGAYSKHPGGPIWHVFRPKDGRGEEWENHVLDDTKLPGEDGAVADLNGDGRPDLLVAGGKRIKIYFNEGK